VIGRSTVARICSAASLLVLPTTLIWIYGDLVESFQGTASWDSLALTAAAVAAATIPLVVVLAFDLTHESSAADEASEMTLATSAAPLSVGDTGLANPG
jgi:hypothetical protein